MHHSCSPSSACLVAVSFPYPSLSSFARIFVPPIVLPFARWATSFVAEFQDFRLFPHFCLLSLVCCFHVSTRLDDLQIAKCASVDEDLSRWIARFFWVGPPLPTAAYSDQGWPSPKRFFFSPWASRPRQDLSLPSLLLV